MKPIGGKKNKILQGIRKMTNYDRNQVIQDPEEGDMKK